MTAEQIYFFAFLQALILVFLAPRPN